MAQHRKPRPPRFRLDRSTARGPVTLALTGAAAVSVLTPGAQAAPAAPADARDRAEQLYREAEVATEKYNGTKEKADTARRELDRLRDEAARRTDRLNETRRSLSAVARSQYRSNTVDPALQLVMSTDPDAYLRGVSVTERAGARQAGAVHSAQRQLRELAVLREEAADKLEGLRRDEDRLDRHKRTVQHKLAAARRLMAAAGPEREDSRGAARASRDSERGLPLPATIAAPDSRAAAAIAFARSALGSPYVWGATGPDSFDCSGLTQAAYRAAGVSLPRTTYTQIKAGQRIGRSQLLPGDLVFFYSGISHVGLYIGDGRMIHAPRPGAPVRVAPIDEMPFAGATRVA